MADKRRIVVYFETDAERQVVLRALGEDARFYADQAEAAATPREIRILAQEGLTVDVSDRGGPGSRPTPEVRTALAMRDATAVDGLDLQAIDWRPPPGRYLEVMNERRFERLSRSPLEIMAATLRWIVGAVLGGLVTAVGILILLQQLGAVDPVPATAVTGLLIGAIGGIALGLIGRFLRRS